MGEVILLPLDVLKIKMQTGNMTVISMRGVKIADLYKGILLLHMRVIWLPSILVILSILCMCLCVFMPLGGVWTALRNGPGSFALFGTSALVSYEGFGLEDAKQASFIQTSVASCAGK